MSVTVLVMTDGRLGCLGRALSSLSFLSGGPIVRRVLHDDSGDDDYRRILADSYGSTGWEVIGAGPRRGFAGAYRHAYDWLIAHDTAPWVWSTEDDFVHTRPVDLDAIVAVMGRHSHLTQMALRRQPWNDIERAAGGIVESRPREYADCRDGDGQWLEHRLFHTTNPSLVPRRVIVEHPWPTVPHSEGVFSAGLFADRRARAAYWGARESGEWVRHIGKTRAGHGY